MNILWNKLHLDPPPSCSWRVVKCNFDIDAFVRALNEPINELKSQSLLHTEAAILSRLIYRMKSKFRNDKGLKNMEKVNRGLLNYLSLSLLKELEKLKDFIEKEDGYLVLPSKQLLEYVLVRTQGFSKLLVRIAETARIAGHFFKIRIDIGHAWGLAIIAYAILSRIWVLSLHLIRRCCVWYNNLHGYLKHFNTVGVPWLPDDYIFPFNLKTWLDLPWIDKQFCNQTNELTDKVFKFVEANIDNDDAVEIIEEEYKSPANFNLLKTSEPCIDLSDDNLGEPISREEFSKIMQGVRETPPKDKQKRKKQKLNPPSDEVKKEQDFNYGNLISSPESAGNSDKGNASSEVTPPTKKKKKKNQNINLNNNLEQATIDANKIKTTKELDTFLNMESYPGLDKLRWTMVKKNTIKLKNKLYNSNLTNKNPEAQKMALTKVIRRLRKWMK